MLAESNTEPPAQKDVAGEVMVAVGNEVTVMVMTFEVAVHPVAVTTTLYLSAVVAVYVALVAPDIIPEAFDHLYVNPVPVFAESITEPPAQKDVAGEVMNAVGNGFTVTIADAVLLAQPFAVAVIEYVKFPAVAVLLVRI